MERSSSSSALLALALLAGGPACGALTDAPGNAGGTEQVGAFSADDVPGFVWNNKTDAKDAITALYSGINWYLCVGAGVCPESDAHREATRIINSLETTITQLYADDKIGDANTLLDLAAGAFARPAQLLTPAGTAQEQTVVNLAISTYDHFSAVLNNINPADPAQVKLAYVLAPYFNLVAAVVDNVAQLAQKNPQIIAPPDWLGTTRRNTLATDEALVGSQSVWYGCPGAASQTMISTVQTFDNSLPTKKLWMKFANYDFSVKSDGDTYRCNVSRRVTAPNDSVCPDRTACDLLLICHAGSQPGNQQIYAQELPKIMANMNRDTVVVMLRTAMERIVGLAAEHGSGLLVRQPSGETDLWQIWSRTSYRPSALFTPSIDWQPMATGDFDGDGDGDILWRNGTYLSMWLMSAGGVATFTPVTTNPPVASKAYAGDLDGDGISDVVWVFSPDASGYTTLTWMMNAGSTIPRSTSSVLSGTDMVQGLGNFDNDSARRADVLYRAPATGDVKIRFNGGAVTTIGFAPTDWQIKGVGDFNGDHYADILWYNVNSGAVAIWAMQGTAIIANVGAGSSAPSGGWRIQGVTDVDHDGISDIVWQSASGMISNWIMAGPSSVRDFTGPYNLPTGATFAGVLDLGPPPPANAPTATLNESFCGASTGQLRNPGFGSYEQWWGASFFGSPGTFLGDVDGDMKADMIGIGSNYIGVIRSTGNGFGAYETWVANRTGLNGTHGSLVGDFDGDNKADIYVLQDTQVTVMRSTGSSFQEVLFSGLPFLPFSGFFGTHGTVIGDIDGDKRTELIALDDSSIRILRYTGQGAPTITTQAGAGYGNHGSLMGDIDGDGRADQVALSEGVVVARRSIGTTFGAYETWANRTFFGGQGTYLVDVDGDGRADLVAVDTTGVRVMRSTGISFGQVEAWWGQPFFGNHATVMGDIDGNGKADLAAAGDGFVAAIRSQ
jgi:hypothetical protein